MLTLAQNDMETGACPRRSLTLDELRWLEASAWFEGRASRPASPAPSDRDSFPPRWSTLSTSAPDRSSAFPSHYDLPLKSKSPMRLRCVLTPPTPSPTPPPPPYSSHAASIPRAASKLRLKDDPLPHVQPSEIIPPDEGPRPTEWINRRPRPSRSGSSAFSQRSLSQRSVTGRPGTRYAGPSTTSVNTYSTARPEKEKTKDAPFWKVFMRPRSRTVPSEPRALKTHPSQALTPSVAHSLSTRTASGQSRTPSMSSLTSSMTSDSSARPETPSPPLPSSKFEPHHRGVAGGAPPCLHHRTARTSSVTTKDSAATKASAASASSSIPPPSAMSSSKSVKFAAAPTVHYASAGYWEVEARLCAKEEESLGIDLDSMDFDLEGKHGALVASLRPPPSPRKEKKESSLGFGRKKSNRSRSRSKEGEDRSLRRLVGLRRAGPPPRPSISGPYALGTAPVPVPRNHDAPVSSASSFMSTGSGSSSLRSKSSLRSRLSKRTGLSSSLPLRRAPSMDSVKSSGARSLGSIASTTGSVRGWLGRIGVP
ncbi:hypothetical protein EV121DRAFT_205730 [Schizophyllum commune]